MVPVLGATTKNTKHIIKSLSLKKTMKQFEIFSNKKILIVYKISLDVLASRFEFTQDGYLVTIGSPIKGLSHDFYAGTCAPKYFSDYKISLGVLTSGF